MKCLGCGKLGHPVRNCPDRPKEDKPPRQGEPSYLILAALEEYLFLLKRDGVWAILDTGATKSVGGSEAVEDLQFAMGNFDMDIEVLEERPTFSFGNGGSMTCISTVNVPMVLANRPAHHKISILNASVPILLGMDLLTEQKQAIFDCGRGMICSPMDERVFYYAERLPGNHLAVCLTSRDWWSRVPQSIFLGQSEESLG